MLHFSTAPLRNKVESLNYKLKTTDMAVA